MPPSTASEVSTIAIASPVLEPLLADGSVVPAAVGSVALVVLPGVLPVADWPLVTVNSIVVAKVEETPVRVGVGPGIVVRGTTVAVGAFVGCGVLGFGVAVAARGCVTTTLISWYSIEESG